MKPAVYDETALKWVFLYKTTKLEFQRLKKQAFFFSCNFVLKLCFSRKKLLKVKGSLKYLVKCFEKVVR